MGFRPMPDIESLSITVYNDSVSQNATTSSLTTYRIGNIIQNIIYMYFFFHIEFLTQYDTTYVEECSPTVPASKLQAGQSCEFTWSDIVTSECI